MPPSEDPENAPLTDHSHVDGLVESVTNTYMHTMLCTYSDLVTDVYVHTLIASNCASDECSLDPNLIYDIGSAGQTIVSTKETGKNVSVTNFKCSGMQSRCHFATTSSRRQRQHVNVNNLLAASEIGPRRLRGSWTASHVRHRHACRRQMPCRLDHDVHYASLTLQHSYADLRAKSATATAFDVRRMVSVPACVIAQAIHSYLQDTPNQEKSR